MPIWLRAAARVVRRLPKGRYVVMASLARRLKLAPFLSPLDVANCSFVCDLQDGIAREAAFMGHYEPQETVLVRSLLHPGSTFVDVGANWGYFSLLAASTVGSSGKVLSLEPHPQLYPTLVFNLQVNRFDHAQAFQLAASNTNGQAILSGFDPSAENRGTSRLGAEQGRQGFPVATTRLDSFLDAQGIQVIDVLKMDIEGAEALALPPLMEWFSHHRIRALLLELHPEALAAQNVSAPELLAPIFNAGYQAWIVRHDPKTFRDAAYRLPSNPTDTVTRFMPRDSLDAWPHLLFLAPGLSLGTGSTP